MHTNRWSYGMSLNFKIHYTCAPFYVEMTGVVEYINAYHQSAVKCLIKPEGVKRF